MMVKKYLDLLQLGFVCLTVVLAPLYVIRWSYFDVFPTTLLELLIMSSFALFLLRKIFLKSSIIIPSVRVLMPVLLFLLGATVALFTAQDIWSAFGIYRAYILEPLLFAIVVFDVLTQPLELPKVVKKHTVEWFLWNSLILSSVWVSIMGIIQVTTGLFVTTSHQADRAHAVFNNGNALALFIGPILLITFFTLFKNKIYPKWQLFLLVVLGLAFLLSKSTGGILAMIICLIILFIANRWKQSFVPLFSILGATGIFLIFLLLISFITPQVDNPWVRPGGTAQVRTCVWEGTRDLLFANPILGASLRGFQEMYSTNFVTCDAEPLVYPHSLILNFWVETGILGILGILALFVLVFTEAINKYSLFFLYTFWHGLVDVPYFKNDLSLLFWLFFVLWLVSAGLSRSSAKEINRS